MNLFSSSLLYLPEIPANTRVREEVTPRLVRHCLEMLDQLKQGREATPPSSATNAVVRRLAEGYGASAINQLATSKDNTELEALLQGVCATTYPSQPSSGVSATNSTASRNCPTPKDRYSKINPSFTLPSPTPSQSPALARWTRLKYHRGWNCMSGGFHPSSPQNNKTYCNTSISNLCFHEPEVILMNSSN